MTLKRWSLAEKWTAADAAHLLRRAGFGGTADEIEQTRAMGLDKSIAKLIEPQRESEEFQYASNALRDGAIASGNIDHLKCWWMHRMRYSANPLVEKMTLLWHNHFATSNAKVRSVPLMLAQNDLFREHALGSFRTLLHESAKDVAMLIWLDGNANRKRAANENFAREIMELFSLGVGNYTEKDIQEAARAFTGWHVRNEQFWFDRSQHDPGTKTVFGKSGNFTGKEIVDLCVDQPACARFIAFKLLRCFVADRPDKSMIDAVAQRLRETKFSVKAVMSELLVSELFFGEKSRASIIRSPIDFGIGFHRELNGTPNFEHMVPVLRIQGQDILEPPTVKGWDGGRLWIGAATLLSRTQFTDGVLSGSRCGAISDPASALGIKKRDADSVAKQIEAVMAARPFADQTRNAICNYLRTASGNDDQKLRGAIHLAATSPECLLM